jgi:hypothetical protein
MLKKARWLVCNRDYIVIVFRQRYMIHGWIRITLVTSKISKVDSGEGKHCLEAPLCVKLYSETMSESIPDPPHAIWRDYRNFSTMSRSSGDVPKCRIVFRDWTMLCMISSLSLSHREDLLRIFPYLCKTLPPGPSQLRRYIVLCDRSKTAEVGLPM